MHGRKYTLLAVIILIVWTTISIVLGISFYESLDCEFVSDVCNGEADEETTD